MQKTIVLKTLFDIQSDREINGQHSLLLEVGKDYSCYGYWHRSENTIDRLQFISFTETETEAALTTLLDAIKQHRFQSVFVCNALPQALLVPTKYFNGDYSALDIIYDQPAQEYEHDTIPEWQMVTIYSLPKAVHQLLQDSFSSVQYIHAYTPSIKLYNGYAADNQLSVHFTPQHFRVLLKKDAAIHLAQTYQYQTPLDVVYYLLKICYEFGLDQSSVYLILSGLIEKESALYTELQHYFANVHFAHPTEIKLPQNDHPQHFFTSLYNLATCVS